MNKIAIKTVFLAMAVIMIGLMTGFDYNEGKTQIAPENSTKAQDAEKINDDLVDAAMNKDANKTRDARELQKKFSDAMMFNKTDKAKELIEQGADVNGIVSVPGDNTVTPLFLAVGNKNIELVKLLIEKGADVNAKTSLGGTPLMIAVNYAYRDLIDILMKHGADINAEANDGTTPLSISMAASNDNLTQFLIKKGAKKSKNDAKPQNNAKPQDNNEQDNNENKRQIAEIKQPYYELKFSASACTFAIQVNNIELLKMEMPGQMGTKFPINNAIFKSGTQNLSVSIEPLKGETYLDKEAKFEASVGFTDANAMSFDLISEQKLETLKASSSTEPLKKLSKEFAFTAQVPYEINILDNASDLRSVPDIENKVKNAYNEILNLVKNKELDKLKKLYENKLLIRQTAFYLSEEESAKSFDSLFDRLISDSKDESLKPASIPQKGIFSFFADGKLVKLTNENGDPALTFSDGNRELSLDISFYLPKGNKELEIF